MSARLKVAIRLPQLLQTFAGSSKLLPMMARLMWALSKRLERVFKGEGPKQSAARLPLHLQWKGKEEAIEQNLDCHLAGYCV